MTGGSNREVINGIRTVAAGRVVLDLKGHSLKYVETQLEDIRRRYPDTEYAFTGTEGNYCIIEYEKERSQSDYLD